MKPIVLVASSQSYRTGDFLEAARLLGLDPTVATDGSPPVQHGQLQISLSDPTEAAAAIAGLEPAPQAVVAIDDHGVEIAARASTVLGLPGNPPSAAAATRDKLLMRRLLAESSVTQPAFAPAAPGETPSVASQIGYPAVVKPTGLSAGRGVIRVDDVGAARRAETRVRGILSEAGFDPEQPLLVEQYLPGQEVAVEGLVAGGTLEVLAVIDKPDPMEGPYFEETMLVTPSRLAPDILDGAVALTRAGVEALGLVSGPVHVEVRVTPDGVPHLLEVAARSIGGLCGRALTFGMVGESLEVLVLRSALGQPSLSAQAARPATGVLMLPIPATGTFVGVEGKAAVEALDGIDAVTMTVPEGRPVRALPEGDRYLGFVFASGLSPRAVEQTLREAAARLTVVIDGEGLPPVDASGPAALP